MSYKPKLKQFFYIISQSFKPTKQSMNSIIQILQKHGVQSSTTVEKLQINVFQKRPQTQTKPAQRQMYQVKFSLTTPKEIVQKITAELAAVSSQIEISQSLGQNAKMPHYTGLKKVFAQQDSELNHKDGEVLLVDVWATWCGPCQKPMSHNQQMLQKNQQKWKDKVRIVAVSVDDDKQVIQQRVNAKGWKKIQHLTLLGWDGSHPLISNFSIQGIPFVFLVDKFGNINYSGHPSGVDLQKRINELLQAKDSQQGAKTQQTKQTAPADLKSELNKVELLNKVLSNQSLQSNFQKTEFFCIFAKTDISVSNGKLATCSSKIKVSAYEDQPQIINQFKKLLEGLDQSSFTVEQNLVKFDQVPHVQNPKCADCDNNLTYPYYWCKWDPYPNTFRCRDCVQKKSTVQGKHYNYQKNSVFLPGPWKRLALKGLGTNIQPQTLDKVQGPHSFGCNGCGGCPIEIGTPRYICLACRSDPNPRGDYIDVCGECFNNYCKGDNSVKQNLNVEGHTQKHPLLRILYNVNGYYQF